MTTFPAGERSDVWPNGIPLVGQSAAATRVFTRDDIERFDDISLDRNPFHHDHDFARASPLNGICLQSGVFTSIFNEVLSRQLPGPWTFFLEVNWSYKLPVRPDEVVTGMIKVVSVRSDKPISLLQSQILLSSGELALDGTILAYTYPQDASNGIE